MRSCGVGFSVAVPPCAYAGATASNCRMSFSACSGVAEVRHMSDLLRVGDDDRSPRTCSRHISAPSALSTAYDHALLLLIIAERRPMLDLTLPIPHFAPADFPRHFSCEGKPHAAVAAVVGKASPPGRGQQWLGG